MPARDEDDLPADDLPGLPGLTTDPQFLKFLEAGGNVGLDPLSDDGLRAQAAYIALVGDHPLDTLKSLSKNVFVRPSARIAAAKALLEYGARKVPAQLELSAKDLGLKLDVSQLAGLSAKELAQLEKLLLKAQEART